MKSGKNDYPGISLKVKIEPLHITLHQKVLEFLKEYAANCQEDLFEDKTAEEINPFENYEEENLLNEIKEPLEESKKEVSQTVTQSHSDIFIERISVSRFYVQFNYRSYKLSMTKLYNRSEERRVGKECLLLSRYRWSLYHLKKQFLIQRLMNSSQKILYNTF